VTEIQRTASQRYALQIRLLAGTAQTEEERAHAEDSYTQDAIRETRQNLLFIMERVGPKRAAVLGETIAVLDHLHDSLTRLWD
jgi:hypothetical protein